MADPIPAEWIRALLPAAILAALAEQPLHGYGIAQALGERGLGTPRGGSLYPVLGRLERDDLVTSDWVAGDSGPAKKQYTITAAGRERAAADRRAWHSAAHALGADVPVHATALEETAR